MGFLNRIVSETQIRLGQRLWLYIVAILILIFLVAPSFIVVPMSFSGSQYLEFPPENWSTRWYLHYFNSSEWMAATWTSIKVAVMTIFVATPIGTMAAYGMLNSSTKITRLLFVVMISPIMIPLILVAIGVFYFYVKVKMVNSILGLVLAHSLIAMPLVLIIVMSALNNYDMNQEKVARSLGATRLQAFFQITLPQIRFSIISSALIAFLTSFDEVIIALFISGGPNSTITRSMFLSLRDQIDPTIASISTILIVISSGLLIAAQTFGKRKDSD